MNKDGSDMLTLDPRQSSLHACCSQKGNIESKRYGFDSAWRRCILQVFKQASDRLTQRLHKPSFSFQPINRKMLHVIIINKCHRACNIPTELKIGS